MKNKKNIIVIGIVVLLFLAFLFAVIKQIDIVGEDNKSDKSIGNANIQVKNISKISCEDKIDELQKMSNEERTEVLKNLSEDDIIRVYETVDKSNRFEFDNGRLKLEGSASYEGPDFETGSMKTGIYTSLRIRNISDKYLDSAELVLKINEKDKLNVMIQSVQPGELVFCVGTGYEDFSPVDSFEVISCKSKYDDIQDHVTSIDGLKIQCENWIINVENNSDRDLSGYRFVYKGKQDDILMGGTVYSFEVDSLKQGETYQTNSQSVIGTSIEIVDIIKKGE